MACGQSARQTRSKGACTAHSHYRHFLYYFFFPHNKIFLDLLQEHKSHITLVLHSQHVFDAVPGCSTMQVIYVGSRQCSKDKFHLSSDLLRDNQVISLCFRYNPTECGYDAIFLWNVLLEWIGIKKINAGNFQKLLVQFHLKQIDIESGSYQHHVKNFKSVRNKFRQRFL